MEVDEAPLVRFKNSGFPSFEPSTHLGPRSVVFTPLEEDVSSSTASMLESKVSSLEARSFFFVVFFIFSSFFPCIFFFFFFFASRTVRPITVAGGGSNGGSGSNYFFRTMLTKIIHESIREKTSGSIREISQLVYIQ
jgi:hypothetical protein